MFRLINPSYTDYFEKYIQNCIWYIKTVQVVFFWAANEKEKKPTLFSAAELIGNKENGILMLSRRSYTI